MKHLILSVVLLASVNATAIERETGKASVYVGNRNNNKSAMIYLNGEAAKLLFDASMAKMDHANGIKKINEDVTCFSEESTDSSYCNIYIHSL